MKLLLVEDDQALSRELAGALEETGIIVECADTGSAADYQVMTQSYDVVILDLGLPDGNAVTWLEGWRSHNHAHPQIQVGDLTLDTQMGQLTHCGMPVSLTAQEYRLMERLMQAFPRTVSRQELAEFGYESDHEPDSNVIDVQISRLRRKLGATAIETLRGRGYRLAGPVDSQ